MRRKSLTNVRYENVNLISLMGFIVDTHTEHYKSDFEIDKVTLKEAAHMENISDRTFIWICRKNGTWLLKERNLFIKDTREYNTLCYYAEQSSNDNILFAVEITGITDGGIRGNLYALNYAAHYAKVVERAQNPSGVLFVYENGQQLKPNDLRICISDDATLGKFIRFEFVPKDEEMLAAQLAEERRIRNKLNTVKFK